MSARTKRKSKSKRPPAGELVTVEMLGERYTRMRALDIADGCAAFLSDENHFVLALLFISTGQYKPANKIGSLYRIPRRSSFHEKSLAAREAVLRIPK